MQLSSFSADDFDHRANKVSEWVFVADDLLAATRFLCVHSYHLAPSWGSIDEHFPSLDEWRITPVILMLRSMALECLLKALYVKHCGAVGVAGRYKKITRKNEHDLLQIAEIISRAFPLDLSDAQREFLQRASLNIVRGRYPVHMDWIKHNMPHASGDRRWVPGLMVPNHDDELFTSICEYFRRLLAEEVKVLYRGLV